MWCFFIELQISTMSGDLDLSPPDVPEPTFFESVLRYGLFLGAIFQLVCILAIIIPTSKSHEQEETSEPSEHKTSEPSRKPKAPAQQIRQKLKKESKKKR
ncbi:protein MANBAL isoform X1 [Tachysurus fulvidraco]|uniref:protein MANBAL isoform X1 n=2 Tax=Tachysurus fulvidraco TaxID=1234273 RepID=UPI000F4DCCEA|nr:protein MANBAL isoform X1 [Tachysurus fulvidraco]